MRKLWCSSFMIAALLIGCKQNTATEGENANVDTTGMTADSLAVQPDRTNVEPDSVPIIADTIKGNPDANPSNNGDSKAPGAKPKPGTMSQVDSIKASYPPKK